MSQQPALLNLNYKAYNITSILQITWILSKLYVYMLVGNAIALDVYQYSNKGLNNVIRQKSKRVSSKVARPKESREF